METTDKETSVTPETGSATLAAVGYVPPLFLLPLVGSRSDDFTRFHGRQSLAIFLLFLAAWVAILVTDLVFGQVLGRAVLLGFMFRAIAWLLHYVVGTLLSLAYIGVMIAGIVQAAQGRWWRVPYLGTLTSRFGL
jgi:uncharacterized membrane protein